MISNNSGLKRVLSRTLIAAAAALAAGAQAASIPTASTPQPRDLGAMASGSVSVTVSLKQRNADELDALLAHLYTPGHAQFHKFVSAAEFHQRFDPSAESLARATAFFTKAGLTVQSQGGRMLEVSGPAPAIQKAFGVTLHQFEIPAHGANAALRFHAPLDAPAISDAGVASLVDSVVGLDDHPRYAPNSKRHATALGAAAPRAKASGRAAASGNEPGEWTVSDLAHYYHVDPLYAQGLHGEGKTLGIVTLASFTPSDAYEYWAGLGLQVDPQRISVVEIDGGSGAISDAGGSGETTLDVEQSGGLAPAAKIVVYEAPNTDHSFIHAFAKAVNENRADSISVSWGEFEWFETLGRTKARRGNIENLKAFNQIFMQAAAQGQSVIAAQGDEGAYEANRAAGVPQFDPVLSVGAPGSSPWITSAGGTTLPGTMVFNVNGNPVEIDIPTEQVWGWDYLHPLCQALGLDDVSCGIWGAGGGGGVSSFFRMPAYQKKVAGMRVTEAGQSLFDNASGTDYVDLPAGFAGRNVPDVSLNADPETGYTVLYTQDDGQQVMLDFYGGTSFVAPQLNGIAALVQQKAGGRVGLLNFPLYQLARSASSYTGAKAPLVDIAAGDNWFYAGAPGYDQGSGVGVLDVANFAAAVAAMK